MPKIKPYLLGSVFGAGLTFVACQYHVVRHSDGLAMVPRSPQHAMRSAYVDIRDWGPSMWKQYPEVATALVSDGQGELMVKKAAKSIELDFEEPLDDLDVDSSRTSRSVGAVKSTSTGTKGPLVPIRMQPSEESLDETSFGSRTKAKPEVGDARANRPDVGAASKTLKSSLESLFAPYDDGGDAETSNASPPPTGKAPLRRAADELSTDEVALQETRSESPDASVADRNHVAAKPVSTQDPGHSAVAPDRPLMELESLDVDLGEPVELSPSTVLPRRAETLPTGGISPLGQADPNASDIKSL